MALQRKLRGTGLTARPQIVFTGGAGLIETLRALAKKNKFEGWVLRAEEWARVAINEDDNSPDSDADFAVRILKEIDRIRRHINSNDAGAAAMAGVRLGELVALHDTKMLHERTWLSGKGSRDGARKGGRARGKPTIDRNIKMAQQFDSRRYRRGRLSDTALKTEIGKKFGLKRSAAIAAIDAGLKKLSGIGANRTGR